MNLDAPAIGRTIKRLFHEDRPALIRMLSLAPISRWHIYARAWLMVLGVSDEATIRATIPGIIFVWSQLVREYNAARHDTPDQAGTITKGGSQG